MKQFIILTCFLGAFSFGFSQCVTITNPSDPLVTFLEGQSVTFQGIALPAHLVKLYITSTTDHFGCEPLNNLVWSSETCSDANGAFMIYANNSAFLNLLPGTYYYWAYCPVSSACGGIGTGCCDWFYRTLQISAAGFAVDGRISYDNAADLPLDSVSLALKDQGGNIVQVTMVNSGGIYGFSGIQPGTYSIVVTCSKMPGGYNAADALLCLLYFTGQTSLSGLRLQAADVNANQYVNAADALTILKRFVGMIQTYPSGDWLFEIQPLVVTNNNIIRNIRGICVGDVNADWIQ